MCVARKRGELKVGQKAFGLFDGQFLEDDSKRGTPVSLLHVNPRLDSDEDVPWAHVTVQDVML